MAIARKALNPLVYALFIGISLIISIALLYINFSDFVMPYSFVIGLLIVCAVVSLGSYISYCRAPGHNLTLRARLLRIVLLAVLGIIVTILIALPVLVIENA